MLRRPTGNKSETPVCDASSDTRSPLIGETTASQVRYGRLRSNDSFTDAQFASPPQRIPWKAIVLACALFFFGTMLNVVSILIIFGVLDQSYSDRVWPMIILGSLIFVPGFYHVRIAYYAFTNQYGYSFDDIPSFD